MTIYEKVVTLLAEKCNCEVSEINMETTFESLGIDSLDTVEILIDAEEILGFELELTERVATVSELMAFIDTKIEEHKALIEDNPELAADLEEKLTKL
jgi:acyl carrier protein